MATDRSGQLVKLSTGEVIATLSDAQMQTLVNNIERESVKDTNFYITPETVNQLRNQGAGEIADLLATALGDAQEMQVGYAPVLNAGSGSVRGVLLALDTQMPLTGYKVEAYDEDLVEDDLLGWCYVNAQGKFEFRFTEASFKSPGPLDLEGDPDVKLRIADVDGDEAGWTGVMSTMQADFGRVYVSAAGKVIAPVLDPGAAAICPACGTLFSAGTSTCSDCDVPVRPLGAARPML